MAHDENIRSGTRYDALRMVALLPPEDAVIVLKTYLSASRELQMGAISGLSDINTKSATDLLFATLPKLNDRNRQLALEALLRTDQRATAFAKWVAENEFVFSEKEIQTLRQHPLPDIRNRFETLIGPLIQKS